MNGNSTWLKLYTKMSLILNKNLIFIHFPKTAGIFLREQFKQNKCVKEEIIFLNNNTHIPLIDKSKEIKDDSILKTIHCIPSRELYPPTKYKTFFLIRNPYAWYCSYINFKSLKNFLKCDDHYYFDKIIKEKKEIPAILDTLIKIKRSPMAEMEKKINNVWKVFKYENFAETIDELNRILEIKINISKKNNVTEEKNKKIKPESKQKIYKIEKDIFKKYSYKE